MKKEKLENPRCTISLCCGLHRLDRQCNCSLPSDRGLRRRPSPAPTPEAVCCLGFCLLCCACPATQASAAASLVLQAASFAHAVWITVAVGADGAARSHAGAVATCYAFSAGAAAGAVSSVWNPPYCVSQLVAVILLAAASVAMAVLAAAAPEGFAALAAEETVALRSLEICLITVEVTLSFMVILAQIALLQATALQSHEKKVHKKNTEGDAHREDEKSAKSKGKSENIFA